MLTIRVKSSIYTGMRFTFIVIFKYMMIFLIICTVLYIAFLGLIYLQIRGLLLSSFPYLLWCGDDRITHTFGCDAHTFGGGTVTYQLAGLTGLSLALAECLNTLVVMHALDEKFACKSGWKSLASPGSCPDCIHCMLGELGTEFTAGLVFVRQTLLAIWAIFYSTERFWIFWLSSSPTPLLVWSSVGLSFLYVKFHICKNMRCLSSMTYLFSIIPSNSKLGTNEMISSFMDK